MSSAEDGIFKLKEGEFGIARKIFFDLLDFDPENISYITGFFISSYWDNRLDLVLKLKEGSDRASKLVQMFDQFEKELDQRELIRGESYRAITDCILSEASAHFRLAFQTEGSLGFEKGILTSMSLCLIKIQDYKNAMDILEYTKNTKENSPVLQFYIAECSYHLGDTHRSQVLFRDALLYDPELLRFEMIYSEPLKTAIKQLKEKSFSDDEIREYIGVYCLEKGYFTEVKEYSREEIRAFYEEMERLETSPIEKSQRDVAFKVRCRILHLGLTILDSFQASLNSDLIRKVTEKIQKIDAGLLSRRKSIL